MITVTSFSHNLANRKHRIFLLDQIFSSASSSRDSAGYEITVGCEHRKRLNFVSRSCGKSAGRPFGFD